MSRVGGCVWGWTGGWLTEGGVTLGNNVDLAGSRVDATEVCSFSLSSGHWLNVRASSVFLFLPERHTGTSWPVTSYLSNVGGP